MRTALLILLTFILQGLVSGLFVTPLVPPDLPYLAALGIAASSSSYAGLVLAFGMGLIQDLLSGGQLGLHGVALLFASYAFYRLTRSFHWDEAAGAALIYLGTFLAKWSGYLLMVYWLRSSSLNWTGILSVMGLELILTGLFAIPFLRVFRASLGIRSEQI
jgi:rod shape-determining protein MreD